MKKRIWSIIMALALILTSIPTTAFYAETQTSTSLSGDFYYDAECTQLVNLMSTFNMTPSCDTLYYKVSDGWTIINIDLLDALTDTATVTFNEEKNVAKISFFATQVGNGYMNCTATNGTEIATIRTTRQVGGVKDTLVSYSYPYTCHRLEITPGESYQTYFYYLDANGNRTALSFSDLSVSDTSVITLSEASYGVLVSTSSAAKPGDVAYIEYKLNGETYQYKVDIVEETVTPDVICALDVEGQNVINIDQGFNLTDTVNTFYLISQDGWTLNNLRMNTNFAGEVSMSLNEAGTVATIKVLNYTSLYSSRLDIIFDATKEGLKLENSFVGLYVNNNLSKLCASIVDRYYEDDEGNYVTYSSISSSLSLSSDTAKPAFFYLVDSNNVKTEIPIENLSVSDPSLVTLSSEKGAVLITATPESSNGDSLTINYETNGITYSFPVTITAHPSKPADASTIWVDFYRDAAGTRPLDNMFGFIYTDQTDTFYLVAKNGWYFTDVELNEILDDVADYSIDDSGSVVKIKLNKMHIDNAFGHSISYTATNGINTVTGMDSLSIYQYQSRIFGYTFKIDENGEYILDANGKLICDTSNKYGTIETYVNSKIPLDINYMKYDEKNHQISSTTKVTNVTSSDTSVCTVTGMGDYVLINTLPTAKEGDTAYIQYTDNGETYSILVKVKSGDFEPTVPSPVWVDFYYDEEATSVIDSTTGFTLTDTEDTYYFIAKNGWTFENITLSNELESIANVTVDESGTIATIKVTGNPSDDSIYAELEYSVSNGVDEVSGIDGVYLYNKKSTLVFRWCSADGGGNLLEDENGNYIPITVRDAETTLNMFLNSEEPIYVYLKNAETKVETQVNYEDLQSSDSSVITISKEKGATLIVVSPTAKVGDVATIDYVIDGEKYSLPVRIISRGFESQLVIRDPDFDANNHPVENIENSTFVGIGSTINTYHTFFFYYIDEEGIETRLDISQLTSSDSDIVKLSKDPSNADAVRVEFVNFGTASIDYTVDGKTHSVEFDVRVPYAGLYTSLNATEKDYIDKFFISPEEENIFYLVAENEYRLTRVELNEYLDAIADIELDESGTFAKITVTGVLSVDAWYEISYDVINTEYGYEVNDILRVPVLNDSQLMYREPYNDYLLLSEIWGYENTSSELFFYYVDKTGVETKVSANQLVTSDPNVVKISENTLNSDATHLEFVGEGSATIAYTIDDITYTLNVEVNAYSPYVDFFDIPDMVNGECFWTYEVTDEEDTFYLVVEDGWKFTEVTLLDEFADIADVQIDTTNGNYATIKVTGVPKNQEYDLKYVVQNIDDPESTDFNFRFIELINSKSACAHADIHIINAKPATCEEDGYTGDGVCIDCEEVVKEGAVIPATGHNYVDGECEHCGEWIGWHEAEDGNWYFYTEGEVDTTINGIVANGDEYWYAVNGKTDFTITTVAQYGEEWWYVENGKVNFTYTGLAQNEGGWWYMENGVLNWDYTGLTCYYDTWYYVENGGLCWNYTGLTEYYGTWYYVENSVLNWGYTGLTEYFGTWYYVENGVLNWNYTGLTCYYDTWYYVEGGILNWNYTGLTCYYDTWYYVESGVLNWGYTGLTCYYDTWYYVEGGVLNWGYTGLTCYYDTWYYVENGILNWSYIGLTEYYGGWYYVEGGVLNWGFTGLVEYYGTWYYVGNGVLDWGFTGNVYQYGTWWYVENGIMIGEVQVG